MKPFTELTRLGRLRRLRQVAIAALTEYGLDHTELSFYRQAGNTLFRVYDKTQIYKKKEDSEFFEPGLFLLRCYQPGWQSAEALDIELAWLMTLRKAGLPVPEPVTGLDGRYLRKISVPGIPQARFCALTRWIKGRHLPGHGQLEHYRKQGQLMANIHNITQSWQCTSQQKHKRHYDWDGLFMNDSEIGLSPGTCWEYLPHEWLEPFRLISVHYRQLIKTWRTEPEVYGLIHADMGLDANVLFWRGQPRIIDFDSSGFGYWMYDLAVSLEHVVGTPYYEQFRDALIEGYTQKRTLSEDYIDKIGLFTAAFYVYYILWLVGLSHLYPKAHYLEKDAHLPRGLACIRRFVEKH